MESRKKSSDTRLRSGVDKKKDRQIVQPDRQDKPAIVKRIPKDIGRHGTDNEKDLNPEE
jgi:hypothetical protein